MALIFIKARTKPCILGPILPRRVQKHSFKHQLHSTHVKAVGWEPHGSFPTARAVAPYSRVFWLNFQFVNLEKSR